MFEQRYERLRVLGEGAFGTAHLVRERGKAAQYVAKEIRVSHLGQKERDLAAAESEVLRGISHPNVIGYVCSLQDGPRLYIVMEYADNGDLAAQIKLRKDSDRPFRESDVMFTHVQLVLALSHIHSRKILHRDLKPHNIFLTGMWIVKLGDFGIAKVLESTTAGAQTAIGTPLYLAPEICSGEAYGIKSDLWSLGVVTYELAALQVPFKAPSVVALVMRVCNAEPDPLPARYSNQLVQIVFGFLQKQPRRRSSLQDVLRLPFARQHMESLLQRSREHSKPSCHMLTLDAAKAAVPSHPLAPMGGASSPPRRADDAAELARAEFFRNRQAALEAKQRCQGISPSLQAPRIAEEVHTPERGYRGISGSPSPERTRGPGSADAAANETRLPYLLQASDAQSPETAAPEEDRRAAVRRKSQLEKEAREAKQRADLEAARREAFNDRLAAKQRKEQVHRRSGEEDAVQLSGSNASSPGRQSSEEKAAHDSSPSKPPAADASTTASSTSPAESQEQAGLNASRDMGQLQDLLSAVLQEAPGSQECLGDAEVLDKTLLPGTSALAERTLRPVEEAPQRRPPLPPTATSEPGSAASSWADERPLRPANPASLQAILEGTQDSLAYSIDSSTSGFGNLTEEMQAAYMNRTLGQQRQGTELPPGGQPTIDEQPASSERPSAEQVPEKDHLEKEGLRYVEALPATATTISLNMSSETDTTPGASQAPAPELASVSEELRESGTAASQKCCCEIM
eukprot:TRINITY_DN105673_c0_g1_i1.p1 TRINITY_DN105673_c0_g1~~TRINITY_DN105673_c0_g1_i1.p1  ORF type:complete len:743 (+),score=146.33 TRINITY_DN105673_c0_g1_i1:76-2304(+)